MKRRFHQCLLVLIIVVLVPPAFLALVLLTGIIGCGLQDGFHTDDSDITTACVATICTATLVLAASLCWLGTGLFFRLYAGFLPRVRKGLLRYYVITSVCSAPIAIASVHAAAGIEEPILRSAVECALLGLYLTPLATAVGMRPERLTDDERERVLAEAEPVAA